MSLIKKLPDAIANKISAGEVVQRPASAVKELLENAIDAGADEITLVIKDAGKTQLQVIDNGCGMSDEDAVMSFERFATSKISDVGDLETLHTLGFRGEALASIASVAQVEMKTKRRGDRTATLVKIDGGVIQTVEKTQAADGTSVSVRNLFFNVPARRKFLKSDATEFKHIYEIIQAQALAHSDIRWTFISDGDEVFRLDSADVLERLNVFFGKEFSKGLLEISETNDYLSLHGFLGKPAMMKRTKNEQFLFVNERITQNRMLSHAVAQGYGELLGEREQPFFLLYLTIDPRHIDVNVHPSKMEIKFDDERNVYAMVNSVVRRAVSGMDFSPAVTLEEKPSSVVRRTDEHTVAGASKRLSYNDRSTEVRSTNALYAEYKQAAEMFRAEPQRTVGKESGNVAPAVAPNVSEPQTSEELFETAAPAAPKTYQVIYQSTDGAEERKPTDRFLWQLHNKYIVTQIKSGLMLIDQHVAHERILYERAVAVMNADIPNSQQLLFPHRIELKPWEEEILKTIKPDLERLGFTMRLFGGRSILIEGVPPDVRPGSEEKILQELLEQYQNYAETLQLEQRDNIAKSYACRSAIMAGDKLSHREMNVLIDQLFATSMPYVCPHGRPIVITLSLEELDKMFGRT
jgi:DNA mismatch repair protein MutL